MANLGQIQTAVRYRLGDRSDLSTTDGLVLLTRWANEAQREICHAFRFPQQEDEITLSTNATNRFVTLPATTYAVLTVRDTTNNRSLVPLEGGWHEYERRDTTVRGAPSKWLHFKDRLYLYLPANGVYTLNVGIWKEPTDMVNIEDSPSVPVIWHDAVKILATRNGWRDLGDDRRAELIESGEWLRFINTVRTPSGIESTNPKRRGLRVRHYIMRTHEGT
jgi:hypothetical protein